MQLILSLFPGVDLLGRGFTAHGFAVVLGPDLLWDTRIEDFHAPPNRFDGIIGGPPCTEYSDANRHRNPAEGDRLLRHFLRLVHESQPTWFLMENVRNVPDVAIAGYTVQRIDCYGPDFGCPQTRLRHIQFGHHLGHIIRPQRTIHARRVTLVPTVTAAYESPHARHSRRCQKQGVAHLPLRSLTPAARRRAIGNGVPIPIAESLAAAVLLASPRHAGDCVCGCGRPVSALALQATPACRKRMQRRRHNHTRTITYP